MPRAATQSDIFNAVAEPRRRQILNHLAAQEMTVNQLAAALGLNQPSVSKHLTVLRQVGAIRLRRQGRHTFCSAQPLAIRPLYEWAATFERFWGDQLLRVKVRAEEMARAPQNRPGPSAPNPADPKIEEET